MAITRAQQVRQMLKDGNFVMQGGVKNYLGKQKTVSDVPLKWQSGPDKPSTELAYITEAEKDLIIKENIHGGVMYCRGAAAPAPPLQNSPKALYDVFCSGDP